MPIILPTTTVEGVTVHSLTRVDEARGSLVAGEVPGQVPFDVRRFFVVFDVASEEVRGQHAHRELQQFLVCLRGQVDLLVDDGRQRDVLRLNSPEYGIHLRPMVWASQSGYSPDALLLVLASDLFRPEEYIRDYSEFLEIRAGTARRT